MIVALGLANGVSKHLFIFHKKAKWELAIFNHRKHLNTGVKDNFQVGMEAMGSEK